MSLPVVGVDCATRPAETGLVVASLDGARLTVHAVRIPSSADDLAGAVADALRGPDGLLALDAPLGWPAQLAGALAGHVAGRSIPAEADARVNRETDRVVRRTTGKKPLEVGADRIARTALAALGTLAAVRQRVPVEMGWTPGALAGRHALEVYPAAVLLARGLSPAGYKKPGAHRRRAEIVDALDLRLADGVREAAVETDHALDAVLCCVAAADYARGVVLTPGAAGVDPARVRREGWIWIRDPSLGPRRV